MRKKIISIGKVQVGGSNPIILIAGPCVIENRKNVLKIADELVKITSKANVPLVFKASYDKANRTSINSFRGLGIEKGLEILKEVKARYGIPVVSDVHTVEEVEKAQEVLDVLQVPAFLCRQTDLLVAAGKTNKVVNVKKGQFLCANDMLQVIKKIESTGSKKILLTERGTSFGYNNLVSDFRSLAIMADLGYPVIFDATHSVQQPGGLGHASGGNSEYIPLLSRCAVAAGCHGVFLEVHFNPAKSLSDGPNMLALKNLEELLIELKAIDRVTKSSNRFKTGNGSGEHKKG